jgi:uncharacterized protein YjbI with pentapeptide repeats
VSPRQRRDQIAESTGSLAALQKTAEDAASVSSGLWLSYLFVFFYIAIAASAVTHVDLLLKNPVKLPFLNIELPLLAFFALIPFLFIILHAYVLVHFVMLAAKAGHLHRAMRDQLADHEDIQEALRRRLPNDIFLQFLAGPKEIRDGGLGRILKIIAWTTLVLGPILLLLLLQVQFLPFHSEPITWIHRLALMIDIVLLWALWPAVLATRDRIRWPRFASAKMAAAASFCAVGFSWLSATFPGEAQDTALAFLRIIPSWPEQEGGGGRAFAWTSIRDLVFNGAISSTTRRRTSISSNTLVLPGFNVYQAQNILEPDKVAWREHLIDLRGRDLNGAVLDNANLTKADLNNAQLNGVSLLGAQLQAASLYAAQLQGAKLGAAQLQGAVLTSAQLQNASLSSAHLEAAALDDAHLDNAVLTGVHVQSASFVNAILARASFDGANVEGASFAGATLDEASFAAALVWMSDVRTAAGKQLRLIGVQTEPCRGEDQRDACTFDEIKQLILKKVPPGNLHDQALTRLELQLGAKQIAQQQNLAKAWADLAARQ